jgi:peptidoglycan/xylan/chitin deacetylase (PgdA/CDA1 family)
MRKSSYLLKYHFASTLQNMGILDRKIHSIPPDRFVILMYHRIIPASLVDATVQPGMYVLPETFERHLRYLSARFEMESMQAIDHMAGARSKRPGCMLTFDDGWFDFYEYAFPLLQKYQVPATVFLPTGYIDSDHMFWTDRLALILQRLERTSSKNNGQSCPEDPLVKIILSVKTSLQQWIEYSINLLKKHREKRIEEILDQLADYAGWVQEADRIFLTWDEVREIQRSGLVNFGSHTVRHEMLTNLDSKEVQNELQESRQRLIQELEVQPETIPFCYPNGNYSLWIKDLVQAAGYSSACTTQSGINTPDCDRFVLKRVAVHQDMSAHEGLLGCRLLDIC